MQAIEPLHTGARPINTEKQYRQAMTRIESLMDCIEHTPEMDLLESESLLVHAYEQLTFPIGNPDPIDAILYQMDELGVSKAELAKWVGGKGRLGAYRNCSTGRVPFLYRKLKRSPLAWTSLLIFY